MPDPSATETRAAAASLQAHLQSFYDGLPAPEQRLLGEILAQPAEAGSSDVAGFMADGSAPAAIIVACRKAGGEQTPLLWSLGAITGSSMGASNPS